MWRRSVVLLGLLLIAVTGCALQSGGRPGTGGSNNAEQIAGPQHPPIPEGLRCYACHKKDIPAQAFHKSFGISCDTCHVTSTWMPYNYSHAAWPLGVHAKVPCMRCHPGRDSRDYTLWQCYGCHHDKAAIASSHAAKGMASVDNCISCHTNKAGAAR